MEQLQRWTNCSRQAAVAGYLHACNQCRHSVAYPLIHLFTWFICSHALHLFIQLLTCLFMNTLHRCSSTIYQVAHQLLVGLPAMRSADMMVLRRCAMTRVVRPAMRPSSAACTSLSDSLSSALVASSSNSTCNTHGSYIGRQSC